MPVRTPGQITGLWGAPSAVAHSYLHPESLRVSRPYRAPRPHGFNLEQAISRYGSRFIRRNVIPAVTTRRGAFRAGQRVQAYGSLGKSIGQSLVHEAMLQGALRQYRDRRSHQFDLGVGPLHIATVGGLPGIIGADIGKELHGQGVIAQAGAKAGDWVARNLPLASAPGDVGGFTKRYGRAFVHDLFNLPGEAIPSIYVPASQLASGHAGKAFHTVSQPFVDIARHPGRSFQRHPLNTALMVYGAGEGGLRVAGKAELAARAAAGKGRFSRVFATVPGTGLRFRRDYSPDPVVRARQVRSDRAKIRQADQLRAQAKRAPTEELAFALRQRASRVDPRVATAHSGGHRPSHVERAVDQFEAKAQGVRRQNRHLALRDAGRALGMTRASRRAVKAGEAPKGRLKRSGRPGVSLTTQGIVDASPEALTGYLRQLEHQHTVLRSHRELRPLARQNERLQGEIRGVLSGHTDFARVAQHADQYSQLAGEKTRGLVERGIMSEKGAERAALIPALVQRVPGVEFSQDLQRHVLRTGGPKPPPELAAMDRVRLQRELHAHDQRIQAVEGELAIDQRTGHTDPHLQAEMRTLVAERDVVANAIAEKEGRNVQDLTNEDVKRLLAEHQYTRTPGFVTQAPQGIGNRAFNMSYFPAKTLVSRRRTGEATRTGSFSAGPELARETVARAQGLIDAHDNFVAFVRDFGVKHDNAPVHGSYHQMEAMARQLHDEHGIDYRPVRVKPQYAPDEQLQDVLTRAESDPAHMSDETIVVDQAIERALTSKGGDGDYTLLPEAAVSRKLEHLRASSVAPRTYAALNQFFRRAVLTTSTKWATGNIVEGVLRLALVRAHPGDALFARKVFDRLNELGDTPEEIARNARLASEGRQSTQAGHFGMAIRTHVHTPMDPYYPGAPKVLRTLAKLTTGKVNPIRALPAAWRAWTGGVLGGMSQIEGFMNLALAGKYMRTRIVDPGILKTGEKAIGQAAVGMRDTAEQRAMADYVQRAYGKYEGFSPEGRKWLILYTPFAAWSLAAVKFVVSVLPKDHPLVTSLLASANTASEEWRKKHGLDIRTFGYGGGPNALPDFLQGTLPTKGGGHQPFPTRYTPFGFWTQIPQNVAGAFVPVLSGSLSALQGQDWKGQQLRDSHGKPLDDAQKFAFAALQLALSSVPVAGPLYNVFQRKGDLLSSLNRQFNPVSPYAKSTKKKGGSKKKGYWNGGGSSSGSDYWKQSRTPEAQKFWSTAGG